MRPSSPSMVTSAWYSSVFGRSISLSSAAPSLSMQPIIDDQRLKPILEKVEAGQRLSFDDGVTLYSTPDILAVGYMANIVRERLHGDTTYFNVNRHINPTDVCVA